MSGWTAAPGLTSGPGISGEDTAKVMTTLPTGHPGTAYEAADVIAFLGSPHANCVHDITGTVVGGVGLNVT